MKSLGIRSTCRFSATQQDTFFKAAAGYSRRQSQRKCLQHFRLRSDRPGRTTVMVSGGAGSSAVNGAAPQRDQGEPSGPPPERRLALLKRIAAFAGPALSIPLADPLMSLIDTIAIGQVKFTFPQVSAAVLYPAMICNDDLVGSPSCPACGRECLDQTWGGICCQAVTSVQSAFIWHSQHLTLYACIHFSMTARPWVFLWMRVCEDRGSSCHHLSLSRAQVSIRKWRRASLCLVQCNHAICILIDLTQVVASRHILPTTRQGCIQSRSCRMCMHVM